MRRAGSDDIPRILDMIEALVRAVQGVQRVDRAHAGASLARLMASPDALVLVTDRGFIAGILTQTTINPERVAQELGWYAEDRSGLRMVRAFEAWARERGAARVVLSTAPGGPDLSRLGYRPTELAWVR